VVSASSTRLGRNTPFRPNHSDGNFHFMHRNVSMDELNGVVGLGEQRTTAEIISLVTKPSVPSFCTPI